MLLTSAVNLGFSSAVLASTSGNGLHALSGIEAVLQRSVTDQSTEALTSTLAPHITSLASLQERVQSAGFFSEDMTQAMARLLEVAEGRTTLSPQETARIATMISGALTFFGHDAETDKELEGLETALRQSEERFRVALKSSAVALLHQDRELRYTWAYNQQSGLSPDDIIGKTDLDLAPLHEAEPLMQLKRRVLESGVGERSEVPYTVNDQTKVYDITVEPRRDAEGAIIGITVATLEITARKKLEAQLRQAQKMEALGTLVGGIAHDFNNLLQGIMVGVELAIYGMGQSDADTEEIMENLKLSYNSSEKAVTLMRQIMTYARRDNLQFTLADLGPSFRFIEKHLPRERGVGTDIKVSVEVGRAITSRIDKGMIEQALLHLTMNALHAVGSQGTVSLKAERVTLGKEFCQTRLDLQPGEYVQISVSDDGVGIPPENLDKIFDPFFTTKPIGVGTGLGLAMVHSTVKGHGGHIEVTSEVGKGTTFTIYLRYSQPRKVAKVSEQPPLGYRAKEGLVILFVDDTPIVRRSSGRMLQKLGFSQVLLAGSGQEAIEIFERENPDLVIMDYQMPGMDGLQTMQRIRSDHPDAKIILSSGNLSILREEESDQKPSAYLEKPYDLRAIAKRLEKLGMLEKPDEDANTR